MKKKSKEGQLSESLRKSPINYFSDLFIASMVVAWILVVTVMVIMAIFSTVIYADNSIWCEIGTLVAVPLSCGGAIWMVKNSVQHAIASARGEQVKADFPAVDASEEISGPEKEFTMGADQMEQWDDIKNPAHYCAGRKYQPKDVIRDWGLNFNLGSAVKYIARAGKKDDTIKDLSKAVTFLQFEINVLKEEQS